MAKNKSIIKLEGTIDKLCFYTLNGKEIVRKASGPSASRIQNDPAFANVKKNNHEFAGATYISKAIRKGWGSTARQFMDSYMASRLTGKCRTLIAAGSGVLGQREGNLLENGSVLLGFPLHKEKSLNTYYGGDIHIETNTDRTEIKVYNYKFSSKEVYNKPPNATHIQFTVVCSLVSNYSWHETAEKYLPKSDSQNGLGTSMQTQPLALDTLPNQWELGLNTPNNMQHSPDTAIIICVGITYLQKTNTNLEILKTNQAMEICAVL